MLIGVNDRTKNTWCVVKKTNILGRGKYFRFLLELHNIEWRFSTNLFIEYIVLCAFIPFLIKAQNTK